MDGFDLFIPIGILLAMFLSSEPKRSAIAFVVVINIAITATTYFMATGWAEFYLASMLESSGAIILVLAAMRLKVRKERMFFYLMAGMLLASSLMVPLFKYDVIVQHSSYMFISELIALIHLTTMLSFSDGIRNFAGNIRDSLIGDRGRTTNI